MKYLERRMAEEQEGKKRKEEMVAGYLRFIIITITITIVITIIVGIFLMKITCFCVLNPFSSAIFSSSESRVHFPSQAQTGP